MDRHCPVVLVPVTFCLAGVIAYPSQDGGQRVGLLDYL